MTIKKFKKKPRLDHATLGFFEKRYRFEVNFKKDNWMLEVLKICKKRLERNPDDMQSRIDVGLIKLLHDFDKAIDKRFKKK